MNKIKLVYDAVKKLREKEVFVGTLDAEVKKDQKKVFGLSKEFAKDAALGLVKAKISTEWDCQGKKGKHESNTEFHMEGCGTGKHAGFMQHMHAHHVQGTEQCCGIKDKLGKISCFLNMLNNMKVEEKGDKGAVLSINLNGFPEEIKKHVNEHLAGKMTGQEHGEKCCAVKELAAWEDVNMDITVLLNQLSEIEKVTLAASGRQKDAQNETHDVSLSAELNLTW